MPTTRQTPPSDRSPRAASGGEVAAIGLDLGTSGLKAVLVDGEGAVLGRAWRGYPVTTPSAGAAESDPALWERAALEATAEVVAAAGGRELVALGVDGQMHGVVLADGHGRALRPAILWPDSRARAELDGWRGLDVARRSRLANPLTPGMTGPMVAWLARHEPATVRRASAALLPKDWLRGCLLADREPRAITDPTDASATLLWDVVRDGWAHDLLADVGVPARLLPEVAPSTSVAGTVHPKVAARAGLPPGLPVAVGCSDAAATLVGSGVASGSLLLTVGTGAQAVLPGIAPAPADPPSFHTYRAVDGWFAMGALLNAGLVLERVVALLGADWPDLYRPYDRDRALPGFLPFAAGERLPTPLAAGSAGWYDVGLGTERADLLAAALEGVAFAVRRVVEDLPVPAADADAAARLAGGGARSPVLAQLLADLLDRPLRRVTEPDATAVGAALVGLRAVGFAGHRPAAAQGGETIEPRPSAALEERYRRFLDQTEALRADA